MSVCVNCRAVSPDGVRFCSNCGAALAQDGKWAPPTQPGHPPPPQYISRYVQPPEQQQRIDDKQGLAVAGLICGIVAFLFLPIVLGPLGIVFGAVAWRAGNKLGLTALIVSVVALPVGMLLGIMVATS